MIEGDLKALAVIGEKELLTIIAVTHADMTTDDFTRTVSDWIATAKHPRFNRPYTELVYQPMLELLALSARERLQDLHRVGRRRRVHAAVGRAGLRHPARAGGRLLRRDEVPAAAQTASRCCGRKPRSSSSTTARASRSASTASSGGVRSSPSAIRDGDLQMLQWTAAGSGARFMGLVHHTDAEREWAYDRQSHVGKLDRRSTKPMRAAGPWST